MMRKKTIRAPSTAALLLATTGAESRRAILLAIASRARAGLPIDRQIVVLSARGREDARASRPPDERRTRAEAARSMSNQIDDQDEGSRDKRPGATEAQSVELRQALRRNHLRLAGAALVAILSIAAAVSSILGQGISYRQMQALESIARSLEGCAR